MNPLHQHVTNQFIDYLKSQLTTEHQLRVEAEKKAEEIREVLNWLNKQPHFDEKWCPWCYQVNFQTQLGKDIKHSDDCILGQALSPSQSKVSMNEGDKINELRKEWLDPESRIEISKLTSENETLKNKLEEMRHALKLHHDHSLEGANVFFEQDGKPIEIATDLGQAYQESEMCDITIEALKFTPSKSFIKRETADRLAEALEEITDRDVERDRPTFLSHVMADIAKAALEAYNKEIQL